ncbi:MAG: fimbria major subunit [Muribaculaceae bacterium]|nr:fimbria major subunit [Muribaculaceae bacterium]
MNYKRYIPFSLITSAMLMLAGCATDNAADEPANGKDDTQFWIQFQMSSVVNPTTQLRPEDETRAGETADNPEVKTDDEVKIVSLIGLLFDVDGNGKPRTLQAVQKADKDDIVGPTNKVTTVTLNMGLNSYYTREQKYRLYVFANLPESNYSDLVGMKGNSFTEVKSKAAALTYYTNPQETGISLGTSEDEGLKIMVWLKPDETYDKDHPYVIQVESTDPKNAPDAPATISLTPMQARFDMVKKAGMSDYKYPVNFNDGENVKPEVYVEFTGYNVVTPSHNVFYFQKGKESDKTLESPASLPASTITSVLSGMGGHIYVPEYIPAVSSGTKLKFKDVTYVILRGKLAVGNDCTVSDEIKGYINSNNQSTIAAHPLYYYDDGEFQSALTTTPHDGQANWHKITWDSQVMGYGVKYYHAVRHTAGPDDDSYSKLEYGVVRNYIYQIGVKSVNALPHPFTESETPVEDEREDISIRITPPTKWIYHRIGTSIKFE